MPAPSQEAANITLRVCQGLAHRYRTSIDAAVTAMETNAGRIARHWREQGNLDTLAVHYLLQNLTALQGDEEVLKVLQEVMAEEAGSVPPKEV
jgi:hypothetical protein